jgi:hypothetical protein
MESHGDQDDLLGLRRCAHDGQEWLVDHVSIPERCQWHRLINAAFGPYAADLLMGSVAYAEICERAYEAMGAALDIGLLVEAFESMPLNTRMFSLALRLRENYSVGIITDNNRDRMAHLKGASLAVME